MLPGEPTAQPLAAPRRRRGWHWALLLGLLLAACDTLEAPPTLPNVRLEAASSPVTALPAATEPAPAAPADPLDATYVPLALPAGLRDELPVMSGICFEAAYDAAGRVFVLRNALEHIRLYDLADQSGLCRRPVTRHPFDFAGGRVLAGLWTRGVGCSARHDLLALQRDDAAQTITLRLRFEAEGTCPYELVRPFWVSVPAAKDYAITIMVE